MYFKQFFREDRLIGFAFSPSRADMCFNCSLSVKSMKFGMMIVFKALKKIGYDAIAKKSVKVQKIRVLKWRPF